MKETKRGPDIRKRWRIQLKDAFLQLVTRLKQLQGNPHYIAMGTAIGVFVSITPTIPFHTVIAIALAFIARGSKLAAAIGVWFCNPVTAPFFYLGSYKTGMILLGNPARFEAEYHSILQLLKLGVDVTCAMIIGGATLGIFPGIAAYFITHKILVTIRPYKKTIDR